VLARDALSCCVVEHARGVVPRYAAGRSVGGAFTFLVDLEPFGLTNDNEVYYAADRPYGMIEGTVLADDASDAGVAGATASVGRCCSGARRVPTAAPRPPGPWARVGEQVPGTTGGPGERRARLALPVDACHRLRC